jgi:hypothetical protein
MEQLFARGECKMRLAGVFIVFLVSLPVPVDAMNGALPTRPGACA